MKERQEGRAGLVELKNLRALSFSEQQIYRHPPGSARAAGQRLWKVTSMCVGGWSRATMATDFRG